MFKSPIVFATSDAWQPYETQSQSKGKGGGGQPVVPELGTIWLVGLCVFIFVLFRLIKARQIK